MQGRTPVASEIATMREALVAQFAALLDRRDELRRCLDSIEATAARERRVLDRRARRDRYSAA
jgi:hypothetical protein